MLKYHINLPAALVVFCIATVCSNTNVYAESGERVVLAKIGNEEVTLQDLEKKISKLPPKQKIMYEKDEKNRKDLLNEIIRIKVFSRQARANGWHKESSFKKRAKDAEDALLAIDYIKTNVLSTSVTPREIKEYYEQHKKEFIAPESIRVSSVYIDAYNNICPKESSDKREIAKKIHRELENGGDFASLPQKYGELAKVENRPDDYFSRGRLIPELEEKVFAMKVGELSPVLETEKGFAIIRMEDKKKKHQLTYSESKEKIRQQLKISKVKEQYKKVEDELFSKYKVNFMSDAKLANDLKLNTKVASNKK